MTLSNEQLTKAVQQLLELCDQQSNTILEQTNQIDDLMYACDQHELQLREQRELLVTVGNKVAELLFDESLLNSFDHSSGSPKKIKPNVSTNEDNA